MARLTAIPEPSRLTTRLASTAGVELAVHDLGGHGDRVLIVAHATGFNGRTYGPFVEHLDGFQIVAPDLRGHGDSSTPEDLDFDWEGLADDVGHVVDHLAADDRLYSFGHSMGAAVSILAEARRPGTFRGIYAFEPIVYPPMMVQDPPRRSSFVEGTKKRRREFESADSAFTNYMEKPPFDVFEKASLDAYIEHGFHHAADGTITLKMHPHNESRMYQMSLAHPTWNRLADVHCPVVVARGKSIPKAPSGIADQVVARLPQGRLEAFDDIGHMGPFEDTRRVAARVQTFFDGLDG
ncbi:MAG: alpha/beta hydrolase [Acidobacteriota bacterium]|nr:alpha/beta hydrolase [Acidobacteriota bacterium]